MWRQWSVILLVGVLCTRGEAHTKHQSGRSAEAALAHHLQQQPSAHKEDATEGKTNALVSADPNIRRMGRHIKAGPAAGMSSRSGDRSPEAFAVAGPQLPVNSSMARWPHEHYGPDFFVLRDVLLTTDAHGGHRIIFYEPEAELGDDPVPTPPAELVLDMHEAAIHIPVHVVPFSERSPVEASCKAWVTQPTVLVAGTPWDSNWYEFVVNSFMPLWQTLAEEQLIDPDRYLRARLPPSPQEAGFGIIQAREGTYASPWSYWFDFLTPQQWLLDQSAGYCYSHLVVVSTSILRFIHPRWFASETSKAAYLHEQIAYMQGFQRWAFAVEDVHWRAKGLQRQKTLPDSVGYRRPRVTLSSRPARSGYQSRGVTNEDEVVSFIEATYDVNITVVNFGGPVEDAMNLMQQTDLLIGMHGAGLTHMLWLRPGSHLLQLAPYGWSPDGVTLIRGQYFEEAANATRITYSHWVNPHAHNALFHKEHFSNPAEFVEHPTDDMQRPVNWAAPQAWIYQSTQVDLESFGKALEQAMRRINVPKRSARE